VQESLTPVTTFNRGTHERYEVQRAGRVGSDGHLERISTIVYAIAVGTVSQRLDGTLGDSQSAAPVLEEPVGTVFAVDDLNFTSIGRGVNQSGQENESDGESTAEGHCVDGGGERRASTKSIHQPTYIAAGSR